MQGIGAISMTSTDAAVRRASERPLAGFNEVLGRAMGQVSPGREAAEQLVATALIQPMLNAMQDDPFRSDLFHGGAGENAFMPQLNQILSDRMVGREDFGLVDEITRYLSAGVDRHG